MVAQLSRLWATLHKIARCGSIRILIHHEWDYLDWCCQRVTNLKWGWGCEGLRSYRRSQTWACKWYLFDASKSSIQCVKLSLNSYVRALANWAQISYGLCYPIDGNYSWSQQISCWVLKDEVNRDEAVSRGHCVVWPWYRDASLRGVGNLCVGNHEWSCDACCWRAVINSKRCNFPQMKTPAITEY